MSNKVCVSVIVPAYNSSKYIDESIRSIINQTYSNFEVIILDDASSDDTYQKAKKWSQKDSRIRVYKNDSNLGIGANRTKGIDIAKGEYICWQDADDISFPDRIKVQSDYLNTHPDVGVVGGFMQLFNNDGDLSVRRYGENDTYLRKRIFRYNPVAQPASMFRKSCYDEAGSYNSDYTVSEDLEMLFRVGGIYKFANVQQVVLRYRQADSSLTATNLKQMELTTLALRRSYKNDPAYSYTLLDSLYNIIQAATIWMPYGIRMSIFKIIRGDKR